MVLPYCKDGNLRNYYLNSHEEGVKKIYDLFRITTIREIKCTECDHNHNPNIVYEHILSIPIDNENIITLQDAIDSFQRIELIEVKCNENGCGNNYGTSTFKLMSSSKYMIIHLKRFNQTGPTTFTKNKKLLILSFEFQKKPVH